MELLTSIIMTTVVFIGFNQAYILGQKKAKLDYEINEQTLDIVMEIHKNTKGILLEHKARIKALEDANKNK